MRTAIQLTFTFVILTFSCKGQTLNFEDFLITKSLLNNLDKDFIEYEVHSKLIKTITEKKYSLDTKENETDSLTLFRYHFDTLGQLLEKQFRFNENDTKFISIKYLYSDNNTKRDSIKSDPYPPILVLDGRRINMPSKECKKLDRQGRIESIENDYFEGEFKFLNLYADYNNYGYLTNVTIYTDKGNYRHEISYEYYEKFKH